MTQWRALYSEVLEADASVVAMSSMFTLGPFLHEVEVHYHISRFMATRERGMYG